LPGIRLTSFRCAAAEIDLSRIPGSETGRGISGKQPVPPVIESRIGDLMLTHFGISGPVALRMSLAIGIALEDGPVSVSIDLRPDLGVDEHRQLLQSDLDRFGKRSCRNILKTMLPEKLVEPIVQMSGIGADKRGHEISSLDRERLLGLLKSLRFNIRAPLPMAEALVTAGGVSLKEVDPRTMASRLVKGLYFGGEVLDLDADTGGFNLQAAFSTGWTAGESAAMFAGGDPT